MESQVAAQVEFQVAARKTQRQQDLEATEGWTLDSKELIPLVLMDPRRNQIRWLVAGVDFGDGV